MFMYVLADSRVCCELVDFVCVDFDDDVVVVYGHVCCCCAWIYHGDLLVYRHNMFVCMSAVGRLGMWCMMLFLLVIMLLLML